jgi:hypothetical protein
MNSQISKYILSWCVITLFCSNCFGQAGFLGSLNSFEASAHLAPSLKRTLEMEIEGLDTVSYNRLRLINPSYSLSYSRITGRKSEISVGFKFSRQRSYNILSRPVKTSSDNYRLLQDIIMNQHGINLTLKRYLKGGIAPIGRFVSFNIDGSQTKIGKRQELYYVFNTSTKGSTFYAKRITAKNIKYEDYVPQQTAYALHFSGSVGKNWIIAKKLLVSVKCTVPFMTLQFSGLNTDLGLLANVDINKGYITPKDYSSSLINTYKVYNGIRFETGLKFFL